MSSFELPSFSLGLDSDSDSEPPSSTLPQYAIHNGTSPASGGGEELEPQMEDPGRGNGTDPPQNAIHNETSPASDEGEELEPQIEDPGRENGTEQRRALKRLRRGLPTESKRSPARPSPDACLDDEIEEFSSDETSKDEKAFFQIHSVGSSSKVPLCGRWVNNVPSSTRLKAIKGEQTSIDHSAILIRSYHKPVLKQTTLSPLRRFHFIDSDSDSPSSSECANEEADKAKLSFKEKSEDADHIPGSQERRKLPSYFVSKNEDLQQDSCLTKNFRIPTPVLDEVCEEYFHSLKSVDKHQQSVAHSNIGNNSSQKIEPHRDSNDNLPPAHRYFFHEDPSIRNLVRSRLRYFFPLGGANCSKQPSLIDYMSQFASGESSQKQAMQKTDSKKSSRRRNKSKARNAEEITSTESWMNPKGASITPQNAGKRRVHADGKSTGHWYTAGGGNKVYVTASGEELTGQDAYRHYRKENRTVFRASKKKSTAKKGKKR